MPNYAGVNLPRQIYRLVVGLAVLISTSVLARADETGRVEWISLAPGLWYRPWSIARSAESSSASGHVFRADPRIVHVTVLDARRQDRAVASVAALRQESGAYLVVNGGFFDEHNRPLGLVVGEGHKSSALRKVDQGIFFISEGKPIIQHTRDPLPENLDAAIQAGPRLVVNGRPLRLKPQASRRTCLCLPGDGTVLVLVFPTAVSLADLAAALVRLPSEEGLGCWGALNLDGGPSTQLSLATGAMSLDIAGGWSVPNGLAILPK